MLKNMLAICLLVSVSSSAAFAADHIENPCKGKNQGDKVTVTDKSGHETTMTCGKLLTK
ncbi:hypothetical protein [Scandinavium goeteborgense]|uniref:hypothetical protein n=1 Tax=Scandinavium goeteborgense TaxID=1851514 RepID=UPI0014469285|nr:hypothetical protein [Scandinavium goeteborgense]QKN79843.1 hypothetical protein A8O29_000540 [Scandinavium goeteborgense]